MTLQELVERYERGLIGREEFIAKLIEGGVAPNEAAGYADAVGFGSVLSGAPLAASAPEPEAPIAASGGPEPAAGPTPSESWWGGLGFWPKLLILGGPLLLILLLFWLCVLDEDEQEELFGEDGPVGMVPGPEGSPQLVFPFPLVTFADVLGLGSVPQPLEDGAPGYKENRPDLDPTYCVPRMDIQQMYAFVAFLQEAHRAPLFEDLFPCGEHPQGWHTACGSPQPPKMGPMLVVAVEVEEGFPNVPGPTTGEFLNPGVVLDRDGDPANNYEAPAETPDDFYQGSDLILSLAPRVSGEPGWDVFGSDPLKQFDPVSTRTRVVIAERWLIFFVPGEHFTAGAPGVRAIMFGASDQFQKTGGDVLPGPPDEEWILHMPETIQTSAFAEEPAVEESPEQEPIEEEPTGPAPDTALVEEFSNAFTDAVRAGDNVFLFDRLHPAVIEVYGEEQCLEHLSDFRDPDLRWEILDIQGPATYAYDPDDLSIPVENVYTVRVRRSDDTTDDVHFGAVADGITWFTDCGTPS